MQQFAYSRFAHLVVVLLAMVALALVPPALPGGLDATRTATAEAERHAVLIQQYQEHGHSHDDGEPHERSPGHMHGHDMGDHMHDLGKALPATSDATRPTARSRSSRSRAQALRGPTFRLDRPPKLAVTV